MKITFFGGIPAVLLSLYSFSTNAPKIIGKVFAGHRTASWEGKSLPGEPAQQVNDQVSGALMRS